HRSHLPTSLSKSVILATPAERRKAGIAAFASKPVAQRMCRREHRFSIWDVRISTETSLPARRPPDGRPTTASTYDARMRRVKGLLVAVVGSIGAAFIYGLIRLFGRVCRPADRRSASGSTRRPPPARR